MCSWELWEFKNGKKRTCAALFSKIVQDTNSFLFCWLVQFNTRSDEIDLCVEIICIQTVILFSCPDKRQQLMFIFIDTLNNIAATYSIRQFTFGTLIWTLCFLSGNRNVSINLPEVLQSRKRFLYSNNLSECS